MIASTTQDALLPSSYRRFGLHNVRQGFRIWRRSRPFWAGVIALLGGLPMWYFPSKALQFLFVSRTPIWAGILVGVLVEMFAIFLLFQPQHRSLFGTLIVIFSLLSFITSDFGGLFIGMLLGILGGSLALAWTPVVGKTPRQQRWLMKTVGAVPVSRDDAILDEPSSAIYLEQPVETNEVAIQAHLNEMIDEDEIDVIGWEVPPAKEMPIIDITDGMASSEDANVIDLDEKLEELGSETGAPEIDLREEKASTAPPPSHDPTVDEPRDPRAEG